jgi:type VI secretion system protein ImpA
MSLYEEILVPIPGDNPSGIDLRYDTKLLIFDKVKEARRQDDELAQGDWQTERKVANWPEVIKLTRDALTKTSKDLQLAAYLTEALLQTTSFAGLRQGLEITHGLLTDFWETVYPPAEDGDLGLRAKPLSWIGLMLDLPIRSAPLVNAGYSLLAYKESRVVGYEDQVKTDKDRKTRAQLLQQGKVAPEVFDKAFAETPKAFYFEGEKNLDACLDLVGKLDGFCDERFGDDAPSFGKLKTALVDVRQVVHQLLDKKREKEPDPVEVVPVAETVSADGDAQSGAVPAASAGVFSGEPANRRDAIAAIAAAAAFLRKQEPFSPAPYLLLRGLRWGELRSSPRLADSALLEAPPTELRQQIKRMALARQWAELLEAGERALAQPGSRAWLDLQRLSVTACRALGDNHAPIANAIESELRTLITDIPELLDASLLDDTPAANPETRQWLQELCAGAHHSDEEKPDEGAEVPAKQNGTPRWLVSAVDPYMLAKDALAAGQEERAFGLMRAEIARQRAGRARFRRTMEMIELAISAGKDGIAQPLLEDIAAAIEAHKLDAWEQPEQIASDLRKLMRYSKKIQGNAGEKQKIFERICRLDPVQALGVE